ncbi:TPA: hypothetical protein ACGOZT_000601 [Streptococcus suis]
MVVFPQFLYPTRWVITFRVILCSAYEKSKSLLDDNAEKTFDNYINTKYNGGEEYEQLKDRARWIKAKFPTEKSFNSHFEKHSHEFGNISKSDYLKLEQEL